MELATKTFERAFESWRLRLPERNVRLRKRGWIVEQGWSVRYAFGEEGGRPYLQYYASHRMTDDRHVRVYADGQVIDLPAPLGMVIHDPSNPGSLASGKAREQGLYAAALAEQLRAGLIYDFEPVRKAVEACAQALASRSVTDALRERDLQGVLAENLAAVGDLCVESQRRLDLPDWPNPRGFRLGGVDLVARRFGSNDCVYLFELKWCSVEKVWEALWDMFKMALGSLSPGVEGAFLMTAAPAATWSKPAACAELFASGRHATRALLENYRPQWQALLDLGAKARPRFLPPTVQTTTIANEGFSLGGQPWSLRAVSVEPMGDPWIPIGPNGWPLDEPHIAARGATPSKDPPA